MNTTMNGTQPSNCSIPGSSKAGKIGVTFAYCLILVVSLVGNSLIAIIVYKTKAMRKTINYFIVNMAMSDLLVPVIILPSYLIELCGGFGVFIGNLGLAFCKVRVYLIYVSFAVSLESLVLITVDRFVAVVFPLRARFVSSKLCSFVILVTWLVTVTLSFAVFLAYKPIKYPRKMRCDWLWEDTLVSYYFFTAPIVFYAISLALIIILYSIIIFKLKSQKIPGENSVSAEEKRAKMNRNVLKMAGAIVIGFILCWTPNSVAMYSAVLDRSTTLSCDITLFWYIAGFLTLVNCAVNPCICFTFSGNYRQGLKGVLGCTRTFQRYC